nr:hypothetical protein [Zooshikella harenae]
MSAELHTTKAIAIYLWRLAVRAADAIRPTSLTNKRVALLIIYQLFDIDHSSLITDLTQPNKRA